MTQDNVLTFKEGKTNRNDLQLPILHFVVTDQWTDVIGEKALFAWLKMYSWCKRDVETEDNQWETSKIPTSFNQIIKRLRVGRETFYQSILRPLWNVGLIDIEEFEDSSRKGQKPMNVIVYKYPQNNSDLSTREITEIRNYDTDYTSTARTFAQKGGRKRKVEGGTEPVQGGVPDQYRGVYQTSTDPRTEIVPNNSINTLNNNINTINNNINRCSKIFNKEVGEESKIDSPNRKSGSTQQTKNKNHTTTTTDHFSEINSFWDENEFGSAHSKKQLLAYLDNASFDDPKEMILRAMEMSCEQNKVSFGYVRAILHDWLKRGIRNLDELDIAEQSRTKKQANSSNTSNEVIPDWFENRSAYDALDDHEQENLTKGEKDELDRFLEQYATEEDKDKEKDEVDRLLKQYADG